MLRGIRKSIAGLIAGAACAVAFAGPAAADNVIFSLGASFETPAGKVTAPLSNADAVSKAFSGLDGYAKVDVRREPGRSSLESALDGFKRRAADADVAVIYMSGQVFHDTDGENYILAAGANLGDDPARDAVSIDRFISELERDGARELTLVVIDGSFRNDAIGYAASRRLTPGLAPVDADGKVLVWSGHQRFDTVDVEADGRTTAFTAAFVETLGERGALREALQTLWYRIEAGAEARDGITLPDLFGDHRLMDTASLAGGRIALANLNENDGRTGQLIPTALNPGADLEDERIWLTGAEKTSTIRKMQDHLALLGCHSGASDGQWGPTSQGSLERFHTSVEKKGGIQRFASAGDGGGEPLDQEWLRNAKEGRFSKDMLDQILRVPGDQTVCKRRPVERVARRIEGDKAKPGKAKPRPSKARRTPPSQKTTAKPKPRKRQATAKRSNPKPRSKPRTATKSKSKPKVNFTQGIF